MSKKPQNGRVSSNNSNTDRVVQRGTADPRLRNATSSNDPHEVICRDFVWGICSKGAQCKYRHELNFEVMKRILKFCHDYQNKSGCTRPGCTYLHISNEEENLFLTSHQIPRILQERYAAMSGNSSSNVHFNEIIAQGPPPPPPPIIPVVGAPAPPAPQTAPLPTLLGPPPPPPSVSTVPAQNTSPVFTGPPPTSSTLPLQPASQPNVKLPLFDATKPPPSLPSVKTTTPKVAVKRSVDSSAEAGPSKLLKEDVSKLENSPCETCVQKELRVRMYQKREQQIACEMEIETFKYQKKLETFESRRMILKNIVNPEHFRILDEYIQTGTQTPELITTLNQLAGSLGPVPRQFEAQNHGAAGPSQSVGGNGTDVTLQSRQEVARNVSFIPENLNQERKSETSPNKPNVPLTLAPAAVATVVTAAETAVARTITSVMPPNRAASMLTHGQNSTPRQSSQIIQQRSTHQNLSPSQGLNGPHLQPHVHIKNMVSAHGMPQPRVTVSQGVASVHPEGAKPPQNTNQTQGMPQQLLKVQPHQNVKQPAPAQYRAQLQNGHVMRSPQGVRPPQGVRQPQGVRPQQANPLKAPPVAVPPSTFVPFQASVPPPKRPQYPQYPSTSNSDCRDAKG